MPIVAHGKRRITTIHKPTKHSLQTKKNVRAVRHLALVRHGQSTWNAEGKWTGWTDVPLSEKGRLEAKKAGQLLASYEFHIAFSSDLTRARETLDIIKSEIGKTDLPTHSVQELRERHYGIFTGKVKWDIQQKVGEERFKQLRRGWSEPIPEGETLQDVHSRVVPHFQSTIHAHITTGKNVLVVAHGNTIRALIKHLDQLSDEEIADVELATGEIIMYTFDLKGTIIKRTSLHIG